MLFSPSIRTLLWGSILATLVSASCLDNIHQDTIGFFSNAAVTFGFEYPSIAECADQCDMLEDCGAWLFHGHGGECQLYRNIPVAKAASPGFTYGVCDPKTSLPATSSSASLVGSSVAATPSVTKSQIPSATVPDESGASQGRDHKQHFKAHLHSAHHRH